jgi:aldose 1-epimerase
MVNIDIQHIDFLGERAIVAQTEYLEMILVPAWGSNVISLRSRKTNLQLLRVPNSAEAYREVPVLYGIPILFPPNRIEDGSFIFHDKVYQFDLNEPETHNHSHGLVFNEAWSLLDCQQEGNAIILTTEFNSADVPHVLRQFPHHFRIRMVYKLEDAELQQTATIYNDSEASFPWGLGYHTTFNFPFDPGTPLSQCVFSLDAEQMWELNERFLPTGVLKNFPYRDALKHGMILEGYALDDAFLSSASSIFNNNNEVILRDVVSGLQLTYRCDASFKHWVIYNDDGKQGYLCPEPYTWITNAPNLTLSPKITGLQVLEPHEEKSVRSTIQIIFINRGNDND